MKEIAAGALSLSQAKQHSKAEPIVVGVTDVIIGSESFVSNLLTTLVSAHPPPALAWAGLYFALPVSLVLVTDGPRFAN